MAIHDWPSVEETLRYRDRVRDELRALVAELEARADDPLAQNLRIFHVVLEHEAMHHETLLYALHELAPEFLGKPDDAPAPERGDAPAQEWIAVPAGRTALGANWDELGFGWDNEFPRQELDVGAFSLERYPTSIARFREFVDDGGYERVELWGRDAFAWMREHATPHPHRWERDGDAWFRRTMFGRVPLDDVGGWPVLVTGVEAEAFARWKGARLPSEAELQHAAFGSVDGGMRRAAWGEEALTPEHANVHFATYDPRPIGRSPRGQSAFGIDELVGNGWEWTATDFAPLPGFEAWIRTYPGYSADFFGGQHAVVFGASWFTDKRFLRRSFRNWFQRRYPYVPATFRLAR